MFAHAGFDGFDPGLVLEIMKQTAGNLPMLARGNQIAILARQFTQFEPRRGLLIGKAVSGSKYDHFPERTRGSWSRT